MAEGIVYKTNTGKHFQLDEHHYFKVWEFNGREYAHQQKCVGWDGLHFITQKQWKLLKPHLKWLFIDHQHTYYKYISNN